MWLVGVIAGGFIVALVVVVVGLAAWSSYQDAISKLESQQRQISANQKEIAEVEEVDRDSSRAAAYRLCQRDSVVSRAVIQFVLSRSEGFRELVPLLQTKHGLPILDCRPNLKGTGADYFTPAMQRRIVERWLFGLTRGRLGKGPRLSNEELGICPKSIIGKPGEARNCD